MEQKREFSSKEDIQKQKEDRMEERPMASSRQSAMFLELATRFIWKEFKA